MLLRVKNLGPIREAELDLGKPLIVLTGPNNSGKTYLAWAAYSLARLKAAAVEPPASVAAWVERLFTAESYALSITTLVEVRGHVLCAIAEALQRQIPEDFSAPREQFKETRFEFFLSDEEAAPTSNQEQYEILLHALSRQKSGWNGTTSIEFDAGLFLREDMIRLSIQHRSQDETWTEVSIKDLSAEETATAKKHAASLVVSLFKTVHVDFSYVAFPVERLAINLFARELAAGRTELVDELLSEKSLLSASSDLRQELQRRTSRYPLVIRDALQSAIRNPSTTYISPYAHLADELEASVLGGSINYTATDELAFVPHIDTGKTPLKLHQTASLVKSLVSLVLFLRHRALPWHRLVIDEPELNLHPDNQRRVARILAKAVNHGLKIMMSTHSDYVIRELNNLVMLGQDSEKARALAQELGYQPEQTLRRDQIGAYLVNGGACTPLEVTEIGFETKTIEDEIHKLNQDAQTIYFRLFED